MNRQVKRLSWYLAMASVIATGCQGGGRGLSLTPPHPLTREARELKQAYPAPLPLPRELDKTVTRPYTVEPGDVLLVQPSSLDSPVRLPGDQPVLPDGRIQLGTYGMLFVAGKTVEQIEADVNALVRARTRDADQITVRIITRESKVYYVLGEVMAPGAFQHRGRETVLDGIIAAGGLNSNASRLHIILSRPTSPPSCRIVMPICYNEIVQLGDTSTNYQLMPGDRIYVPSRGMFEALFPNHARKCPCGSLQTPCPPESCGQVSSPTAPVPAPHALPPAILPPTAQPRTLPAPGKDPKDAGTEPPAPARTENGGK